jgi:hypothetical protein
VAAVACLTSTVLGCGDRDRAPFAREVADAMPRIEQVVGVKFKTPPTIQERSREEVRAFLEGKVTEEKVAADLAGAERAYKRFGLLPETMDLRALMVDVLTEQIAGYYDPETKVLYVVRGADKTIANMTVQHELIHALQDQYLNLDSLQKLEGDNDRQVAIQSMLEGQATYEQLVATVGDLEVIEQRFPNGWAGVRDQIRAQVGTTPVLGTAPLIIQETLIFPYLSGAEFIRRFEDRRPGAVPWDSIPQSTEQILHAEAYFPARDAPLRITLPEPAAGRRVYENNLGEFEIRIFLYHHLRDMQTAMSGSQGWAGDRYVLVETPQGDAVAWLTFWDSVVEAGEFHNAMVTIVGRRFGAPLPTYPAPATREYVARGRTLRLSTGEVDGHPVVYFVDAPQGARVDLLDLRRVRAAR